ncbi:MAG: DUF4214 domain-containing protein [Clostridiales bacterium]|nr:DUF4214 domain-containing protein [Clostridiales bacterium]
MLRSKKFIAWALTLGMLAATPAVAMSRQEIRADVEDEKEESLVSTEEDVVNTTDDIYIDSAHFSDYYFRENIVRTCDADGDGYLSLAERTWTDLAIDDDSIKDLDGIGYFIVTNLTLNGCSQLKKIDLSGNTDLRSLECHCDNVESINIKGIGNLKKLIVTGAKLRTIFFQDNVMLEQIDCYCCPKLKFLNMYGTKIWDPLYSETKLSDLGEKTFVIDSNYVYAHKYQITWKSGSVSFDVLITADETCQVVYGLPVTYPEYKDYFVDSAFVEFLIDEGYDSDNNGVLDTIEMDQVDDVNIKGTDIVSLEDLNLFRDSVYALTVTENDTIKSISLENFKYLERVAFDDLSKAKALTIKECPKLEYIDSSFCEFENADISDCPKLQTLVIWGHNMKTMSVVDFPELQSLNLAHGLLESLTVSDCPKLEFINCECNLLTSLDSIDCKCLTQLDVGNNELASFNQDLFPNLTYLAIFLNPIDTLEIYKIEALYMAALHGDEIEQPVQNKDGDYVTTRYLTVYYNNNADRGELWVDPTLKIVATAPTPDTPTPEPDTPSPEPNTPAPQPDTPTPEPTTPEPQPDTPTPEPAKDPSFEDFVERLYTVALGRASEAEGKAFWVDQVVNKGFTGADCARFFLLDAPEFLGRNLPDDEFVETLYLTFFGRASEADGKAYWLGRLSSGSPKADLVNDFIESVEWCNICATYGVKSGAQWHKATIASKNAIKFATRLYTCCLGRDPEEDGLNYWSLALTNLEATGFQAASLFFESPEFQGFNTSNEEYLRRLYTTFMGREADADGFNYWLGLLNGGTSRTDAMKAFASCPEFQEICNRYGIDRGDIHE